jgi:hypothetical protein
MTWRAVAPKGKATANEANGTAHERAGNPNGQDVAFLRCSKAINMAPANGQWHSIRFSVMVQLAYKLRSTECFEKITREETCVN